LLLALVLALVLVHPAGLRAPAPALPAPPGTRPGPARQPDSEANEGA